MTHPYPNFKGDLNHHWSQGVDQTRVYTDVITYPCPKFIASIAMRSTGHKQREDQDERN